jgi:hypothetical protein
LNRRAISAEVFRPDETVRIGLTAGGNRIRTISPRPQRRELLKPLRIDL